MLEECIQLVVVHLLRRQLKHVNRQPELGGHCHHERALATSRHTMQEVAAPVRNAALSVPKLRGQELAGVLQESLCLVKACARAPRQHHGGDGASRLLPVLLLRVQPVEAMVLAIVVDLYHSQELLPAPPLDCTTGFQDHLQHSLVTAKEGDSCARKPPLAIAVLPAGDPDPLALATLDR